MRWGPSSPTSPLTFRKQVRKREECKVTPSAKTCADNYQSKCTKTRYDKKVAHCITVSSLKPYTTRRFKLPTLDKFSIFPHSRDVLENTAFCFPMLKSMASETFDQDHVSLAENKGAKSQVQSSSFACNSDGIEELFIQ